MACRVDLRDAERRLQVAAEADPIWLLGIEAAREEGVTSIMSSVTGLLFRKVSTVCVDDLVS